jgi:3-oxoacyl-[acyl-carrier protein] reductase
VIRHTVVITGATKGLGRSITLEFARAGYRVLGLYSADEAAAEKLRVVLRSFHSDAQLLKHDVSRELPQTWSRAEIQRAEGLVLVNNAWASFTPQPFHLLPWGDFETGLNIGLKGSWLCARALLGPMVRSGRGIIVNVLTSALHGLPPRGFAAYAVAKHALRGLTLALAAEYGAKGIRVFSVSPSFMLTELTSKWDARLIEAVRGGAPATNPVDAAHMIRDLVDKNTTVGRGEDYSL